MSDPRAGGIAILDFGSQYTQLIARRVREQGVYAAVLPWDTDETTLRQHTPRGLVLSGGPRSVYEEGAPSLPPSVLASRLPVLGICYGLQLLAAALGGEVAPASEREYGRAQIERRGRSALFAELPDELVVWMSHGDRLARAPAGFRTLAQTANSPYAAIGDEGRGLYGLQFHPEVAHTPQGRAILRNFIFAICGCRGGWSPASFIADALSAIRARVGEERVLLGLSGGVDSAVTASLLQRAVGDQLTAIFVDNGLLRAGEREEVCEAFGGLGNLQLEVVDARAKFLGALRGITDPEQKRKVIGAVFIDCFAEAARAAETKQDARFLRRLAAAKCQHAPHSAGTRFLRPRSAGTRFLAQGTIYPDIIESAASSAAARSIKSHHNVGGLPADLQFELIEPLSDLFKDEVRAVGEELGLPAEFVWRQPFPGPGLAVRCLGEVSEERLVKLRAADAIFRAELGREGLLRRGTAQAFAVLLPVRSVGVQGDVRSWEEVIALRAVTSEDFMTADWARLDASLLARVSERIVNEVRGVNRVVYDITSKPPGTIEWE